MELMIDAKESRDVRKARCALACRVARHLRAEDQKVMRMPERENGLAEWLRWNEGLVENDDLSDLPAFLRPQAS